MIDSFDGEYEFLSNFYPAAVSYRGFTFRSSEAAYQFAKVRDENVTREIVGQFVNATPAEAKKLGKRVDARPDWDIMKLSIMERILRSKFNDEILKDKLLETDGEELVEGNWWGDTFWGVCKGKGQNHLGKLLMMLRNEYKLERAFE